MIFNIDSVSIYLLTATSFVEHFVIKCPNLLLKQRQDLMSEFAKGTYEGPDKTLRTGKCPNKKQCTQGLIYRTISVAKHNIAYNYSTKSYFLKQYNVAKLP